MMKVAQAIGIIMGANIGTSITGWILCLSYIDGSSGIAQLLSTATISAIVAIIGIILRTFVKKKPIQMWEISCLDSPFSWLVCRQ